MKKLVIKNKFNVYYFLIGAYIFFSICFPYNLNLIRFGLLVCAFLYVLIKSKYTINNRVIIPMFLLIFYNLFSALYGLFVDNPGVEACFKTDIIWLFVMSVAFLGLSDRKTIYQIERLLVFTALILSFLDFLAIISVLFHFDIPLFSSLVTLECFHSPTDLSNDIYGWFRFWHMPAYLFLIPYSITLFFLGGYKKLEINKYIMICLLFFEMVVAVFSNRTALILVVGISVIITLVALSIYGDIKKVIFTSVFLVIVVMLLLVLNSMFGIEIGLFDTVYNKLFNSYSSEGVGVRAEMHKVLLTEWAKKPFVGWGSGASANGFVRSDVITWTYESFYYDMLFKKGLLGLFVYFAFVGSIALEIFRRCVWGKNDYCIFMPIFIGFVCAILGSSEEQYLQTLGNMWMIFLPFSVASCKRLTYV